MKAHDDLTFNVIGVTMAYYDLTFNEIGVIMAHDDLTFNMTGVTMENLSKNPLACLYKPRVCGSKAELLRWHPCRVWLSLARRGTGLAGSRLTSPWDPLALLREVLLPLSFCGAPPTVSPESRSPSCWSRDVAQAEIHRMELAAREGRYWWRTPTEGHGWEHEQFCIKIPFKSLDDPGIVVSKGSRGNILEGWISWSEISAVALSSKDRILDSSPPSIPLKY